MPSQGQKPVSEAQRHGLAGPETGSQASGLPSQGRHWLGSFGVYLTTVRGVGKDVRP
jgi:hypothetical protein